MAFPLYLDEDSVHRALIRALQARGMDVSNAVDAGLVAMEDLEQLEQMRRLLRLNRELSAEEMRNRAEFLSAWG